MKMLAVNNIKLDTNIKAMILNIPRDKLENIEEIRLRANQPLICKARGEEVFVNNGGQCKPSDAYYVTDIDVKNTIKLMSNFSLFSFDEQLRKGFFTLKGGHRVGVCGKTVIENGEIVTIKDISSLNIRISREILGCSDNIMKYIVDNRVQNTLILSPPNNGKTTLLRDLVRNISDSGFGCVIIDERSEIAGSYNGEAQVNLGTRCDVLDACDKILGISMAIRSMAPDVIIVDEIGTVDDIEAVSRAFNSGVNIVATTHCESLEEFKNKKSFEKIIEEKSFDRYVFMKNKRVSKVFDRNFNEIFAPIFG